MTERIPLARPDITEADLAAVRRVVASGRLSLGPETERFEHALAAFCGTRGAVAVSSGTAGLQLVLETLDIGPGDEVITTAFTFVATANAIRQTGATLVLVDIDPDSMNLDPAHVGAAITPRTRAIMPVHVFGRLADMQAINRLADQHGLFVIEDACEALGARRREQIAGAAGTAGVFGFYPNKIITCGEGGMIVSDDADLLDRCRRLRNHGRSGAGQQVGRGYNFRMTEMQAVLGRSQLERIGTLIEARSRVASAYRGLLHGHPGLRLPGPAAADEVISWFAFVPRLCREAPRDAGQSTRRAMATRQIETGHYFPALHRLAHLDADPDCRWADLTWTEDAADRGLALPIYPGLDETAIERVFEALTRSIDPAVSRT